MNKFLSKIFSTEQGEWSGTTRIFRDIIYKTYNTGNLSLTWIMRYLDFIQHLIFLWSPAIIKFDLDLVQYYDSLKNSGKLTSLMHIKHYLYYLLLRLCNFIFDLFLLKYPKIWFELLSQWETNSNSIYTSLSRTHFRSYFFYFTY